MGGGGQSLSVGVRGNHPNEGIRKTLSTNCFLQVEAQKAAMDEEKKNRQDLNQAVQER